MKAEQLLRLSFPGREDFNVVELSTADAILSHFSIATRCTSLPTEFVAVGDIVEHRGHVYRCVERSKGLHISEACSGCDFDRKSRQCAFSGLQCSSFDRCDGRNVWFVEE